MALRLEDYAMIGDTHTGALVGSDGSIDWLCLPRFDSGAVFAALLGEVYNGRWLIAPTGGVRRARRRYRSGTLVLDTEFETDSGAVRVTDFMPRRDGRAAVVRLIEGIAGHVPMRMHLVMRFDYGRTVPWVRRLDGRLVAVAGPDALVLDAPVATEGEDRATVAEFAVAPDQRVPFVLSWLPSTGGLPGPVDALGLLEATEAWWRAWSARCTYRGEWHDAVSRSCATLKALTYGPTGGIVAALTTSLPERLGGVRNWDYRYVWLRDATLTLHALLATGYLDEARAWRDWLVRAVAGDPAQLQVMYGVKGERRLPELELDWLSGYEGSRPVRVGNAAVDQLQLDVFGEVMDALYLACLSGCDLDRHAWDVQRAFLDYLESAWQAPDEGIWEVRGPRRHFTHSKVMAWVAFDRAVKAVEELGRPGPSERWRRLRDAIHDEVCREAFDPARGTFTQSYGSGALDASLLLLPLLGFLPRAIPESSGPSRRSSASCARTAWSFATAPTSSRTSTQCQPARGHFSPAASGWPARSARSDDTITPERCSSVSSASPTTWGFCPRSTTSSMGAWWGTSPRRSPTSPSSTPPGASPPWRNGGSVRHQRAADREAPSCCSTRDHPGPQRAGPGWSGSPAVEAVGSGSGLHGACRQAVPARRGALGAALGCRRERRCRRRCRSQCRAVVGQGPQEVVARLGDLAGEHRDDGQRPQHDGRRPPGNRSRQPHPRATRGPALRDPGLAALGEVGDEAVEGRRRYPYEQGDDPSQVDEQEGDRRRDVADPFRPGHRTSPPFPFIRHRPGGRCPRTP